MSVGRLSVRLSKGQGLQALVIQEMLQIWFPGKIWFPGFVVFFFSLPSFSVLLFSAVKGVQWMATSYALRKNAKAHPIWCFCCSFSYLVKSDNTKNKITPSMTVTFDLLNQCCFSGKENLPKDKIATISDSMPCFPGFAYKEVMLLGWGADTLFGLHKLQNVIGDNSRWKALVPRWASYFLII